MNLRKGRPPRSQIRDNIIEILGEAGRCYGYELCKIYKEIFPSISWRSVYYHLKKGVDLGIFIVDKVEIEEGDYSWGSKAEKIYYALGSSTAAKGNTLVREFFQEKRGESKKL